ncbi:MAG: MFS transporter [Novosphingobium sp.]|nr:MFS transporter [Novosphingobium sp.]
MAGSATSEGGAGSAPQYQFTGGMFMALLIFTQLPGVLSYTIPLPMLAAMASDLAHDATSEFLIKLVAGAIGPAMAVGSLAGGLLADRIDRRWLLMSLGAIYIVAALAPYSIASLEVIVATRIIVGIAAGALMAIGFTMVGDYLPENKRAGTIGMMSALNMITALMSLPAAGFVAESGWRPAFLLYFAMVPLVVLAGRRALPVPRKQVDLQAGQSEANGGKLELPWGLIMLGVAVGIILTVPGIYFSFHLASVGLDGTSTVAMVMMGNSLIAAIFSASFGKATSRLSWKMIFVISFATLGFGLVLLALAANLWLVVVAMLVMGIGMGWLAPGIPAKAVESVGEGRRGTVVGIVQGAAAAAPLVGLTLLEPLVPVIGTLGVLLIVASLSLLLFLGYAVSRSDRRAEV